jgi:hypothetical protein
LSGGLQHVEDDGVGCRFCGAKAVGPCARCEAPLCGDCCVIVRGAAKPYAVCPPCERQGTPVGKAWRDLLLWLGGILLVLVALVAVAGLLADRR